MRIGRLGLCVGLGAAVWLGAADARALVPECGGITIDKNAACELRVSADCAASCDLGSVLTACAADLAAACDGSCNFEADITCTDDCGSTCEDRCKRGDVKCHDGCVEECVVLCPDQCADGDEECVAACESTCGRDCDSKCGELSIDATCLEHCNQCCHGMCTASANFDCQISCQAPDFTACRDNLLDSCEAACSGAGAVFCDGEFIVGGADLDRCVKALVEQIDFEVEGEVEGSASLDGSSGCSMGASAPAGRGAGGALAVALVAFAGWMRTRRRR